MHSQILRVISFAFAALSGGCQLLDMFAAPAEPPPTPATIQSTSAKPLLADRVVVMKSQRTLELLRDGKVIQTYPIALGAHWRGLKRAAGDGRTPEGLYTIDRRSERTRYTRELHISYPNAEDRARAKEMNVEPGGGIFIHGLPRDYGPYDPPRWERDWTDGCISVGNAAIVKIWDEVPDGTPIEIQP
jgi:murein L,D-transpeptidase YafK